MTVATRGGHEPSPSRLCFGVAPADAALGNDTHVRVSPLRWGALIDLPIFFDIAAPWQLGTRALRDNLAVRGRTKDAAP